jgi:hypothetical protein
VWHPVQRSLIPVTISSTGLIYFWNRDYIKNWSAYTPEFKELEEDREDEFDWLGVCLG